MITSITLKLELDAQYCTDADGCVTLSALHLPRSTQNLLPFLTPPAVIEARRATQAAAIDDATRFVEILREAARRPTLEECEVANA